MNARERRRREEVGNEIAGLMSLLIRSIRGNLAACAEDRGLSPGEANLLWLLAASGPITTKDLARRLDIDPANASTLLTKLERRGLVRREPSPVDRRRRMVSLTEAGHEARAAIARCLGDRQPTFRKLTTDELTTFRDLLVRVAPDAAP
jgi:DNA-binding MarR family transcriptional regulator